MTNAQVRPMQATVVVGETNDFSRTRLSTGWVLTGLSGAFLMFDAGMKLAKPAVVVQATVQLGYPESTIVGMGAALLASTLLYLIPRTSILGAVLLTAYLGGAVATNVRAEMGVFNIAAPIFFACIAWGGLWLRDSRLQQLLPLKNERTN
jgi:hypothetical protein